jgi:hypothetical protein
MSRKYIIYTIIVVLTPIFLFSQAPNEDDINASISKGLEFLATQQNEDGSWGIINTIEESDGTQYLASERVAYTGFALTKLCERAYELQYNSPFEPDYIYSEHVIKGYEFLLNLADTYGAGTGLFIYETPDPEYRHHEIYNAAIALMAIAGSGAPEHIITSPNPSVNDKSIIDICQQMFNYFAWSQNTTLNPDDSFHSCYGGWNYEPGREIPNDRSDNSITGFVVLALRYAESIGVEIPQPIKDKLNVWVDYIQYDENGGSGYVEPDDPAEGQNLLRTGNLLFQMAFLGDDIESPRVQHALEFIGNHWNVTDPINLGWWDNMLGMYCLKKGFESLDLDVINVDGIDRNWYDDFATFLLERQIEDGSWQDPLWGAELPNFVSTTWALSILERKSPSTSIYAIDQPASSPMDFKLLQNYPNPFNNSTVIQYYIPRTSYVEINIYNSYGQKVKTLGSQKLDAGFHSTYWDGRNDRNEFVESGLFIYTMRTGNFIEKKKLLLIK